MIFGGVTDWAGRLEHGCRVDYLEGLGWVQRSTYISSWLGQFGVWTGTNMFVSDVVDMYFLRTIRCIEKQHVKITTTYFNKHHIPSLPIVLHLISLQSAI